MAQSRLKLNLKGFEDLIDDLTRKGKDVEKAAGKAITESARIVEAELKTECQAAGVPDSITSEIRTKVSGKDGTFTAEVGWELNNYNPKNPSAGYKAIFLNYGTVRRRTRRGYNRGQIPKKSADQQFIYAAKKKAARKVRKVQEEVLKEALEE